MLGAFGVATKGKEAVAQRGEERERLGCVVVAEHAEDASFSLPPPPNGALARDSPFGTWEGGRQRCREEEEKGSGRRIRNFAKVYLA